MIWKFKHIIVNTDPQVIDFDHVYNFLKDAYWCKGIPRDVVEQSIHNSVPFSVIHENGFIGFARLVTDNATFAYLADVYIDEVYRGQGFGHKLVEAVNLWLEEQQIRTAMLLTKDAQGLYASHDWIHFSDVTRIMRYREANMEFYQN